MELWVMSLGRADVDSASLPFTSFTEDINHISKELQITAEPNKNRKSKLVLSAQIFLRKLYTFLVTVNKQSQINIGKQTLTQSCTSRTWPSAIIHWVFPLKEDANSCNGDGQFSGSDQMRGGYFQRTIRFLAYSAMDEKMIMMHC